MDNTQNLIPPPLAGLIWRAITRDDLTALVNLAEECQRVDGGLAFLNSPNELLDRCFPDAAGVDLGAFDASGQLVAFTAIHHADSSDTEFARIVGQVHPELRNQGIGGYLMRWSELQARSLFTATAVNKRLQIRTESLSASADHLYRAHGFQSVFEELVMQRDLLLPLPNLAMPPEVNFTTWQPVLADQFFQAYQAAFRERPGFPGYSADQWISDFLENENFKPEWSLLARAGDQPVGFVTASAEPPGGYVIQVGVIPEQRRRGLSSALITETMRRMKAAGLNVTQLLVNVNNPGAIQTYLMLGFVTTGRRARYERILIHII